MYVFCLYKVSGTCCGLFFCVQPIFSCFVCFGETHVETTGWIYHVIEYLFHKKEYKQKQHLGQGKPITLFIGIHSQAFIHLGIFVKHFLMRVCGEFSLIWHQIESSYIYIYKTSSYYLLNSTILHIV